MYQHRQIHIWITESDYLMLREQSVESRESVSAIVRRLVKNERQRRHDSQSCDTHVVPDVFRSFAS
jgi:hypothetical protein